MLDSVRRVRRHWLGLVAERQRQIHRAELRDRPGGGVRGLVMPQAGAIMPAGSCDRPSRYGGSK